VSANTQPIIPALKLGTIGPYNANWNFNNSNNNAQTTRSIKHRYLEKKSVILMKLTDLDLNLRFDMSVIFTASYSFSDRRSPLTISAIYFVNLKIKITQFSRDIHKGSVRACV
jgi:hypothetical protein